MTYQETTKRTGAELLERIAVVLSKRLEHSQLAAAVFTEILKASQASHVVLWVRETDKPSTFRAHFSSCELEKNEKFEASTFSFWTKWSTEKLEPCMLDGAEAASLRDLRTGWDFEKNGANVRTPWSRQNLLLPLASEKGVIEGVLSLHQTDAPFADYRGLFSPALSEIIINCLLHEKRETPESAAQLAGELWLERNLRLVQTKVHSRIDRDFVLQSAVDTLGNILKVSSCLILRNSGASTKVTHEFVDSELSPLGMGSNSSIPPSVAAQMCERTTAYEESAPRKHEGHYVGGIEALFEGSIRSLAGTAIIVNAESFGAIVLQSNRERKWQRHELKLLEGAAAAVSIALRNAELYQEAKEQVFNLNLLTNLTRQLSSAAEQLFKGPSKQEAREDSSMEAPQIHVPLSGRELEVLRLIASGLSNRDIAQHLFLTESTVELHASRIRKKLKLKSRTALVKFACDNHLV